MLKVNEVARENAIRLSFLRDKKELIQKINAIIDNYSFISKRLYVSKLYVLIFLEVVYLDSYTSLTKLFEIISR